MMNKIRRKRQRAALMLITAAGIMLSLAGIAAARYMKQESQSGVVEAQTFYFTSDLLKEDGGTAAYFIDPMAQSFTIELYNFADSERVTSADITYRVSVTGGTVEGGDTGIQGTIKAGEKSTVPISVIPADKPEGGGGTGELEDIRVVAESVFPYKKTLTGVFKRQLGNQYVVEDESGRNAAVLTMVCADGEKDITVTLPSGVIPDEADIRVTGYKDNKCTFHSPGYGIYSLVLLKSEADIGLSGKDSFADAIDLSQSGG